MKKGSLPETILGLEDPFRELVQNVADYAIFLMDERGNIQTWNLGAQRIKGYAPEEIIGRSFTLFYPEDALARGFPQEELRLAAERGRFEDEGWRLRKDGTRFWANVVITALRDPRGGLRGYSKVTRDLTRRRQEEQHLRESEERFRLLVESVQDYAIFMLDPEGRVVSWNAGAQRIKGYASPEVIGRHFSMFYTEDARKKGWPQQGLEAARRRGSLEEEGQRVRKDGSTFWAHVVITPMVGADGTLRGYVKITRDLSDRKRIEALEKAEKQTNEFLAMLAHELRNPLAPIQNALHLLERRPTADPGEVWAREVLQRQAGQLSRLVDDLLDVNRITRAAVVIDRKPVDLRRVVRTAADAAHQWMQERSHALSVAAGDDPLVVEGDEVRLNQVVQNLLHNAAKYTPRGGRVEVRARREGAEAVLSVKDTGVGMSAELLRSAFELFKQADQGLERSQGGLGVGLTLVEQLVTLHGGTVEARSDGPGKGSEFIVRMPLREEPAIVREQAAPARVPARRHANARRVLVVDDNHDAAFALKLLLETDGHEVRVASDGPGGLALAREYRPDVALLDIGLPGKNGYDVAKEIRADPALAGTVLVAVTGYGQLQDRARASASGFHHHLVKPVEFSALQSLLAAPR